MIKYLLPYSISRYFENRINQTTEYQLSIKNASFNLVAPTLTLSKIVITNKSLQTNANLFTADEIIIAPQWQALMKGSLALKGKIINPLVKLSVKTSQKQQPALQIVDKWQAVTKVFFVARFNRLIISNGEIHFIGHANGGFDFYLNDFNADLNNLIEVKNQSSELPTHLTLQSQTKGNGRVNLKIQLNTKAKFPTFNMNAQMTNLNVAKINDFLHAYTSIIVKRGLFSLYVEAAAKDGVINGYVKPYIKNLEIAENNPNQTLKEKIYRKVAETFTEIIKNPSKDSVATEVPIRGSIQDPNINGWTAIVNLIHHAFIQALVAGLDNTVKFESLKFS